jgi:hypothetical protein
VNRQTTEVIQARQAAGRRYISLVIMATVERFLGQISPARRAEIHAAKASWEAAKRRVADRLLVERYSHLAPLIGSLASKEWEQAKAETPPTAPKSANGK